MTDFEISQIVSEILSTVLCRPVKPDECLDRTQAAEWDSLKHMEIMFSLEERLNFRFSEEELAGAQSSRVLRDMIANHMADVRTL